jgi:hypothetical protein
MSRKALSFTKAVEASAFVLLIRYFSRHMNQGIHFAHFETNVKRFVRNVLLRGSAMRAIIARKMMKAAMAMVILAVMLLIYTEQAAEIRNVFFGVSKNEDITDSIDKIFLNRNNAIINGDLKLIKSMYDTSTKYGTWAYQHESTKVKYIDNWEQKQGTKFTDIIPTVKIRSIKPKGEKFTVNLMCSTEYKYIYGN